MARSRGLPGKRSQWLMIGLFPLIAIGGLWWPWLGYLMLVMMIVLLGLSYFKSRYWCGHFCPRGAFLDIVQSQFTRNRPWPRLFNRKWFRWTVFGVFMSVFTVRMMLTGGNPIAIGGVFVSMCILTSVLAIAFGSFTRPRAWCAICPMGTLQEQLGKTGRSRRRTAAKTAQALPSVNSQQK